MIVLDTHVWLWWVNQDHDRIPDARWLQIEQADTIGVSVISCFEVAWLERHGRIVLPCERATWFDKALAGSAIECLPLTPRIASRAVDLPEHHRDPQDRLIVATALEYGCSLMSFDTQFSAYQELAGLLLN
jgi:PIN domain nuclease of toxin-antitoxin system